jgi:hypothetical protein
MSENLVFKALIEFLNTISAPSTSKSCSDCGSSFVEYGECTFFFEGLTWRILLPICLKCHPIEQVEPPYDA